MSDRTTFLAVRPEAIPALLRQTAHWVLWRYAQISNAHGLPQWSATSVSATTGRLASVGVPATWTDFATACDSLPNSRCDGLSLVLHRPPQTPPDQPGLVALLLGQCRDPHSGRLDDWARDVVQAVGSYTELSPDGTGLLILVVGMLPGHGRKKGNYENYQTGRFLTITGWHLPGTPTTVERRQEALTRVYGWFFAGGGKRQRATAAVRIDSTEEPLAADEAVAPDLGPWSNVCEVPLPLSLIDVRLQRRVGLWPRRVGARLFVPGADGGPRWLDSPETLFAWIEQRLSELGLPALQWQTAPGGFSQAEYFRHLRQFATPAARNVNRFCAPFPFRALSVRKVSGGAPLPTSPPAKPAQRQ